MGSGFQMMIKYPLNLQVNHGKLILFKLAKVYCSKVSVYEISFLVCVKLCHDADEARARMLQRALMLHAHWQAPTDSKLAPSQGPG